MPALAASNYPLLNLFWTMLWFFLWILWIFLLIRIISDVFRSPDLSGFAKAAWTIGLIIMPFLSAFIYLLVRGGSMHTRDAKQADAADQAFRAYVKDAAGSQTSKSNADELHKLADLHERGVLTDQEFAAQKAKLLV